MTTEALSGALNLIMHTINPQWWDNLFGSPLRQLDPDLCYFISAGGASYFSMSKDDPFCHAFRVILLKGMGPAVFQLFGEDITPEAETRRMNMTRFSSGPGGGAMDGPGFYFPQGYGGPPHLTGEVAEGEVAVEAEVAVEVVVPRPPFSKYLLSKRLKALIACALLTTTILSLTTSGLLHAIRSPVKSSWILPLEAAM